MTMKSNFLIAYEALEEQLRLNSLTSPGVKNTPEDEAILEILDLIWYKLPDKEKEGSPCTHCLPKQRGKVK